MDSTESVEKKPLTKEMDLSLTKDEIQMCTALSKIKKEYLINM